MGLSSETFEMQLIAQARAGDRSAFGRLATKMMPRLYGVVYAIYPDSEEVYDILQDSFVKAYRALPRLRDDAAFVSWLFRIAVNTARTRISRRQEYAVSPDDPSFVNLPNAEGQDPLEAADYQRLVQVALQKLSLEHREVVVLVELEGLNCNEVAELLECPAGTVRSRLHYARKQLKEGLEPYRHWLYPKENT